MPMTLHALQAFLRDHLLEHVMPYWTDHAIDWKHGGLFSYLTPAGEVFRREKTIVHNTRALWTFAALCRRLEDRPLWRQVADNLFDFLSRHGRDDKGWWVYVVDEQGNVVTGEDSIIADAFAIAGLTEYYRLTGRPQARQMALETAATCRERLARPSTYRTAPYPTPEGMRAQREAMQFSLMFCELGDAAGDHELLQAGLRYGRDVLEYFWQPDKGVLLEYLGLNNQPMDSPAGRTMVPGHAIESLWFQMHNFTRYAPPQDRSLARVAAAAIRPCLEKGWDPEFGGILLGVDVQGRQPVYWNHADMKRWWPATEAMPALLMAWELLGEDWCLEWYARVHDWAFGHFPDWEHGDWSPNLTREGKRLQSDLSVNPADGTWQSVDVAVKDPFHLPRGLMVSMETLERLCAQGHGEQSVGSDNFGDMNLPCGEGEALRQAQAALPVEPLDA